MTRAEADDRVAKGAVLLDEKRPGWAAWIKIGNLNMHDPCNCILGQLYGDFSAGMNEISSFEDAGDFGFDLTAPYRNVSGAFLVLQDAWIAAIAARCKEQTA